MRSLLLLATAALMLGVARPQPDIAAFEIQKVTDSVYAAIRKGPPGLMFDANSIFIINDADVIVVDTNITPSSARATLAALKRLTPKPVRTVINTHWHDDHIVGNQVYREAFPGVEFIAHARSAEAMATTGAANRKQLVQMGPTMVAQLRNSIEQSKSMSGGGAINDEERASYRSDVAAAERYFAEAPGFTNVPPTTVVTDRLMLTRGKRQIEILHLGRAHTGEDLVVHLPQDRLVITGDLIAWPIPLIGSTSYPAEFGPALEKLAALKPAILIPGHGPVMRNLDYVRLETRLVTSLTEQVRAAVARGATTVPEIRKTVNLTEFEKAFAGDSRLLQYIFGNYVTDSGIRAAFRTIKK